MIVGSIHAFIIRFMREAFFLYFTYRRRIKKKRKGAVVEVFH